MIRIRDRKREMLKTCTTVYLCNREGKKALNLRFIESLIERKKNQIDLRMFLPICSGNVEEGKGNMNEISDIYALHFKAILNWQMKMAKRERVF